MKILIFGGFGYIGQGLAARLEARGHEVFQFKRGEPGRDGRTIYGDAEKLLENPHFPERVDIVINLAVLREASVERNMEFCRNIMALCRRLQVSTLVHTSSCSVLAFSERVISESSAVLHDWQNRPDYAAVKIATDDLLRDMPESERGGVKVVFVRPGFVLAPGAVNVLVGLASRLPGGMALVLGNPKQDLYLITRDKVQEVLAGVLDQNDLHHGDTFLAVAANCPKRGDYIKHCCRSLGQARWCLRMGAWFWYPVAGLAEGLSRLLGKGSPRIFQRVSLTFRKIRYDVSETSRKLGVDLNIDWQKAVREAYDQQTPNYTLPVYKTEGSLAGISRILFIGFGGIVRQKHIPALEQLGFKGTVDVFDPYLKEMPKTRLNCQRIEDPKVSEADLVVVTTPGPLHTQAIGQIPPKARMVMVEKPLVTRQEDWSAWADFEKSRECPVLVMHNYRLKKNLLRFCDLLRKYNGGELLSCRVVFDTGAIRGDSLRWHRNERASRTLLYDFGLHSLDAACMLGQDYQGLENIRSKTNQLGETSEIAGQFKFSNYPVTFHLRQTHGIVRRHVYFEFVNFTIRVTFYPDSVTLLAGDDMILNRFYEFWGETMNTLGVVFSKLRGKEHDPSHVRMYQEAALALRNKSPSSFSMQALESTYRVLADIAAAVY